MDYSWNDEDDDIRVSVAKCRGRRYTTIATAWNAARYVTHVRIANNDAILKPYKCEMCEGFHLKSERVTMK